MAYQNIDDERLIQFSIHQQKTGEDQTIVQYLEDHLMIPEGRVLDRSLGRLGGVAAFQYQIEYDDRGQIRQAPVVATRPKASIIIGGK